MNAWVAASAPIPSSPAEIGGVDDSLIPPASHRLAVVAVASIAVASTGQPDHRILAADFAVGHGIGPVWSPDGTRIAYQRVCAQRTLPSGAPFICREQHEVVLVTINNHDPNQPAGNQVVIAPPQTTGPGGPLLWYPYSVTWSPDGSALLYIAWSISPDQTTEHDAILTVPVNGNTPPAVLSSDKVAVAAYSSFPWLTTQSWERQPDR